MQGQPGLMSLEALLSLHVSFPGSLRWRRAETRQENQGRSKSWGSGHRGQAAGPPAACACPHGEGWEGQPGVGGAAGGTLRLPSPPQEMLGEGNAPQMQLDSAGAPVHHVAPPPGAGRSASLLASYRLLPERHSRPCSGASCTCRGPARLGLRSDRWGILQPRASSCLRTADPAASTLPGRAPPSPRPARQGPQPRQSPTSPRRPALTAVAEVPRQMALGAAERESVQPGAEAAESAGRQGRRGLRPSAGCAQHGGWTGCWGRCQETAPGGSWGPEGAGQRATLLGPLPGDGARRALGTGRGGAAGPPLGAVVSLPWG